jgi:hypothetical protein
LAGGNDGVLPAEVLDDALLGALILAHALDEVEAGVAVDSVLALCSPIALPRPEDTPSKSIVLCRVRRPKS